MFCPTLNKLLPPPPEKTGWPWTEESPQLPDTMPDGSPWPRISIVTPSFNQDQFIEETIRSVLLQGYPDLEYLIIDGGSTDGSVQIIRKYEKWLTYWVSEPDDGQADAINKGWTRCRGVLVGWVNSDDLLIQGSLKKLAHAHKMAPDTIIAGDVINFYHNSDIRDELKYQRNYSYRNFVEFWNFWDRDEEFYWHQPGVFFSSSLLLKLGGLDVTFRYLFDYDFMCRAISIAETHYIRDPIVKFRIHPHSKSVAESAFFLLEASRASKRYWTSLGNVDKKAHDHFFIEYTVPKAIRLALNKECQASFRLLKSCFLLSLLNTTVTLSKTIMSSSAKKLHLRI